MSSEQDVMTHVSTFRLYLLRAGYLLLVVGLGVEMGVWGAVIHRAPNFARTPGDSWLRKAS